MTPTVRPCPICGVMRTINTTRERLSGRPPACRNCRAPKPPVTPADLEWMAQANCIDVDVEIFFDDHLIRRGVFHEYCDTCPVRVECLKYARRTNEQHGIFGGMTPDQRSGKVRIKKDAKGWHVVAGDQKASAGSFATAIKFANTIHRKDEA